LEEIVSNWLQSWLAIHFKKGEIKMKIFYFTATGNSLYVAKKIGGNFIQYLR